MSKLYPVGVQNFEKVILGGYEYVDKTALIYQLFNTGSYYFLSRPRRFGKSLLLSTLEAYAQGKKELFKGLAMTIYVPGKVDTAHGKARQAFPFVSRVSSAVPANRQAAVW